jgi:RNA polymerase sigma factor (sigma-70 family)
LEKYFYLVDFNPLPNEISEKESLKEKIQEAIEKLSSKTREILSLYYNQGLTFREIAQTLNEPINTVKSRHRRAVETLKNRLKSEK